jgi:hypothetical protein
MARPTLYTEQRVTTAVRLPESLHARLQHVAAERDVSVNLLVTRAVARFLEQLAPVADVLATNRPELDVERTMGAQATDRESVAS